jgi:acetolactate synthase-1/2/3 large subunit
LTKGEAIITPGWASTRCGPAQHYRFKHPRQFLTSAGLGAMGYGLSRALGARSRAPNKQVVDIDGDGSFPDERAGTGHRAHREDRRESALLNNQHLGMVGAVGRSFLPGQPRPHLPGDPENMKQIYPRLCDMAKAFNVPCERVIYKKDLRDAMQRMLDSDQPYLLDVITPYTEHVLPFIRRAHGEGHDLRRII